jgi:hypothetical protein
MRQINRWASHLSKKQVRDFIEDRGLSQIEFCQWLGVKPRTLQLWMATAKFPRFLEIIVTHDDPPGRKSLGQSRIGQLISQFAPVADAGPAPQPSVGERICAFNGITKAGGESAQ